MTEDEMVGWHHWVNGHEFEWTPGAGDGQGGLVGCSPWGDRVGHDWATKLNWTENTLLYSMILGKKYFWRSNSFVSLMMAMIVSMVVQW